MRETRAAVLLLYITAVAGQSLDVCSSCHADATCDDKTDGSGKVCNCKYGFVGNGRTFCQDKDECQIGSAKICGQHTTCHNTYGSYFCTCLSGYRPTNNMTTFIPNDGTNCQDIDECEVRGVCGEGARCINLEGSFECRCQNGFRVSDGAEPFHPRPDKAKCKVVDCGPPASPEDCVLVSVTKTTFEGRAVFECEKGFIWRGGNNSSVCEASGRWTAPSLVCEEVDCGPPPVRLHSETLWDGGSRAGSEVLYRCNSGYQAVPLRDTFHCNSTGQWDVPAVLCQETLCGNPPVVENSVSVWDGTSAPGGSVGYYCKHGFSDRGGGNTSVCNELGEWTQPTLSCQEISCGLPRQAPNALMLWDGLSSVGSLVIYRCNFGYQNTGNKNDSSCQENGEWTNPAVVCQEIICGQPTDKANTKTIWDGTAGVGAVAHYECNEGYYASTLKNTSKCEENGLWEDIDLKCEEISCGSPFLVPNTNLRWDGSSVPGSVAVYRCEEGFYPESERSTCSNTGQWGQVSLICNAKCGPVPPLAHAEVLWQNRSVALHRCEAGYHSWTGSSTSTCDHSGLWNQATIKCIKFKPPISQLRVLDDRCLHWNAEKFEESTEVYTIRFTGSRDYQASFLDKRRRILSSQADRVEICLNLLPATNYSISVTAASSKVTVSISTNTSLTAPAAPVVHFREYETPLPTLALVRSPNTMDPISVYHVHVLPVDGLMVFDCSSPSSSENEDPRHYVAAQIQVKDLGTEMSFNVGDGRFYGGYMNAPLENGKDYYIILRAFAEWRKESKSTCVVWAKVKAAAVVGLVALTFLGGYSYFGFFKKL